MPSCGNWPWPRADVAAGRRWGKARCSCTSFLNCSAQRHRHHARSWKKLFHKLDVWHSSHHGFKCDLKAFARNIFIKTIPNVQESCTDKFAINKPSKPGILGYKYSKKIDLDRPRWWVWLSFTLNSFATFFCLFAYSLLVETFCYACRLGYGSGNKALIKWEPPLSDWHQKSWCQMPPGSKLEAFTERLNVS